MLGTSRLFARYKQNLLDLNLKYFLKYIYKDLALFYVPQKCTASLLSLKNVPYTCITMHDSSYKVTNTNDGKFVKVSIELRGFF